MKMKKILALILPLFLMACDLFGGGKPAASTTITLQLRNGTEYVLEGAGMSYALGGKKLGSQGVVGDAKKDETYSFKLEKEDFKTNDVKNLTLMVRVTYEDKEYEIGELQIETPQFGKTYAVQVVGKSDEGFYMAQDGITVAKPAETKPQPTVSPSVTAKPVPSASAAPTPSPASAPTAAPKTMDTLPWEDLKGFWNSIDSSEFLQIEKRNGEWGIMFRDWSYYAFQQTDPEPYHLVDCKKKNDDEYAIDLVGTFDAFKYDLDLFALKHGQIRLDNKVYEYVGQEVNQAQMANAYRERTFFVNAIAGFWNSTSDNEFFGIEPDVNGEQTLTTGLWSTSYCRSGPIEKYEVLQSGEKKLEAHFKEVPASPPFFGGYPDAWEPFFIEDWKLDQGRLTINGKEFKYVGYTMDDAQKDWESRF